MNFNKKRAFTAVMVLASALFGYFALTSRGDDLDDGAMELLPPQTIMNPSIGVQTSTGLVAPLARGRTIKFNRRLMAVLNVSGWPTAGTLDVYLQSSADNGLVWNDFAHMQATSCGITYIPIALYSDATSFPTTVSATSDGTLGLNAIAPQRGIAERIRVKYNATFNANSTNAWAFHVVVKPD